MKDCEPFVQARHYRTQSGLRIHAQASCACGCPPVKHAEDFAIDPRDKSALYWCRQAVEAHAIAALQHRPLYEQLELWPSLP